MPQTVDPRIAAARPFSRGTEAGPPGQPARRAVRTATCCKAALLQSFVMLRPDIQWKNPVMFVVEVGTVLTIVYTIANLFGYPSAGAAGLPAGPGLSGCC